MMKNYNDVVKDRFDTETDSENSIYSPNHPIGKYIRKVLFKGLDAFLLDYSNKHGDISEKTLLDVGCGNGGMLAYFIQKGFLPHKSTGIDLSHSRIESAQNTLNGVTFKCADILSLDLNDQKFDIITSFDLFSHITTEDQLVMGLSNVCKHLNDDGVFLWYDIYSKDHYAPRKNSDSWGFNIEQMIQLSNQAGFELEYSKTFFKSFFNKYQSVYQVKRLSPSVVSLLEKVLPGMPGNIMLVLKKSKK